MKPLFAILLFIGALLSAKAQDLIVTTGNDSLNCKITKVETNYLHYLYTENEQIKNRIISKSQVRSYSKNYFYTAEIPVAEVLSQPRNKRLSLHAGLGYLTARSENAPSEFDAYLDELRSGIQGGVSFQYYLKEHLGAGIAYTIFHTKAGMENVTVQNTNGQMRTGRMEDNIRLWFLGPSFATRYSLDNKTTFIANFSLGYLEYRNKFVLIDNYLITGSTVAFSTELGLDFLIDADLSFGTSLTYTSASIRKVVIDDGRYKTPVTLNASNAFNMSRFDLSIGLKWHL